MPDALLDSDIGGSLQVSLNLTDFAGIGVVVPDGLEGTVTGALDEGVGAVLRRIGECVELRRTHVGRIEAGALRLAPVSREEGFSVDAVPGTVIDFGIAFFGRIRQGAEKGVTVAEILPPVDLVHFIGGHTVQPQDFFPIVGNPGQVRGGDGHQGVVLYEPAHIHPVMGTGNGQGEGGRHHEQSFHTVKVGIRSGFAF